LCSSAYIAIGKMITTIPHDSMIEYSGRRLMWHGVFLFLLGLLAGLLEQRFSNPRMGLAAHLEGLMNGTFVVAIGAVWAEVRLPVRSIRLTFWTLLFGSYANTLVTSFAAVFGTGAMTPLAGAGHHARSWQEALVTVGFISVGLSMIAVSGLLLWGLSGPRTSTSPRFVEHSD
jgi:hydroxylaminobenzene mutase